ncbi:hypothetical protein RUND412_009832 [Rhizina undulata]
MSMKWPTPTSSRASSPAKIEKSYTHSSDNNNPEQKKLEAGAKKETTEKAEESGVRTKYWVSERTVGEFQRSFSFPGSIDIDAVKASLEHGILKIAVPKKEQAKGRKIEFY